MRNPHMCGGFSAFTLTSFLDDDRIMLVDLYDKEHHLEQLGHISGTLSRLENTQFAHVKQARLGGATWQEIADMLGVTRQAAHVRWSKRV